jgi:hypothetical protein
MSAGRLMVLETELSTNGERGLLALEAPEQAIGVVAHLLLAARAVGLQHGPRIGETEHRLEPGGDVVGEQRDRAGRRDRQHQAVADAVPGDRFPDVLIEPLNGLALQIRLLVEQREDALLRGQLDGGEIGGALQAAHPLLGQLDRLAAAVAGAAHDEGVAQAGDAESYAALGQGLVLLLRQGKARAVDGVVEHAHGERNDLVQVLKIERGVRFEGPLDQSRQVDRPEQAGAVRRQGLLSAWIARMNFLAVPKVVHAVDAVDEDHAGLGVVVGRPQEPVPEVARRQAAIDRAAEHQVPGRVLLDRLHEGVADQDREVEHAQPPGVALGVDEVLDVRVVAAQRCHHGAAARAGAHDRPAHGVPDVHEAERPRGVGAHALDRRTLGPEGREVVADAAALLQGQRRFLQVLEDPRHVVGDGAHDEAVEQGDVALGPGARQDPAGRQKLKALERRVKPRHPGLGLALRLGERARDPAPRLLDGFIHRLARRGLEAVFHVPDLLRQGRNRRHGGSQLLECRRMLPRGPPKLLQSQEKLTLGV